MCVCVCEREIESLTLILRRDRRLVDRHTRLPLWAERLSDYVWKGLVLRPTTCLKVMVALTYDTTCERMVMR